jgi:hypothetical protein
MTRHLLGLLLIGILFLFLGSPACAQEQMVDNPYYKFWANTKPESVAVHLEKTKLAGPEGKLVPGGVDEKRVSYKLVSVDKDKAIVEMVATEEDFLGYIQSAPTRHIYPAKLPKSKLERLYLADGGKPGEDVVQLNGKSLTCKTVSGTVKGPDGEEVDFRVWLSDEVPGTIVKQVRTARQKGQLIAETTITLESYK